MPQVGHFPAFNTQVGFIDSLEDCVGVSPKAPHDLRVDLGGPDSPDVDVPKALPSPEAVESPGKRRGSLTHHGTLSQRGKGSDVLEGLGLGVGGAAR